MNLDVRCQSGIGELRTDWRIENTTNNQRKLCRILEILDHYKKGHRNLAYYKLKCMYET